MSDLFRSALGYLSNSSGGGVSSGGVGGVEGSSQHGSYSSASGGPQDDTNAIGELIPFTFKETQRNVRIQKLIAEGGFSYVYRGVDVASGENVAIKKILAPDGVAVGAVEAEVEFMRQFHHTHIINFYGSYLKSGSGGGRGARAGPKNLKEYYLGMEYCPVSLPTPPFRLEHTTQIFAQTSKAIKYLHDFGIIHRDIKLENLLIGTDGLIKLVDFGSATMDKIYPTPDWSMAKRTLVEEDIASKTTPMYRAPEMLDLWSNYPIDERVDYWALGCLLFAMHFGQHPFQDSNKLAIVNANYSLPKNVSHSGPIVSLIRGLLKVSPSERLSFGQIFEVLNSIAESSSFSLSAPLPFKAATSPNVTGGGGGVPHGIVNPLASSASQPSAPPPISSLHESHVGGGGGSASLFSSLKGGAVSLIKNLKEQSQQYLVGPNVVGGSSVGGGGGVPPPRPLSAPTVHHPPGGKGPPPRPAPPSPNTQRKEGGGGHIEFENREYEAMMGGGRQQENRPQRPAPPKPPPPKIAPQCEPPKVANLLDIGFESAQEREGGGGGGGASVPPPTTTTADLLGDLFGSGASSTAGGGQDFLWANNTNNTTSISSGNNNVREGDDVGDLMGDPFASLLGKSVPTNMPSSHDGGPPTLGAFSAFASSQPFVQPVGGVGGGMPSSTSFHNLNVKDGSGLGSSFLGPPTSSKIPKNSSSPNLLSDLILDDIMGDGMSKMNITLPSGGQVNVNKSNPSINQSGTSGPPTTAPSTIASNQRPNYNRNMIFDPPAPQESDKKQKLDDVFADILNSQGFAAGGKDHSGKTINDLRKIEMYSNPNMNPTQIKVNEWREGKKKNIRALLASLHTVTWEECHWEETNMSQMITPPQLKKTYRKACLAIHPDKQMGKEWEELAKMIFVELNEAWAAFEESQQQ